MSDSNEDQDAELKLEIQKELISINEDMIKLKDEILSLRALVQENASLPTTAKLSNEKLIIVAKEAGIDLENLENVLLSDNSGDESENQAAPSTSEVKTRDTNKSSMTNVEAVVAAAEELTDKVKRALRAKK